MKLGSQSEETFLPIANEIKENATRQLMAIPKKDFSDCFEKWKERWDKCVRSQGEYFEGN
jgi:hypothetical protein